MDQKFNTQDEATLKKCMESVTFDAVEILLLNTLSALAVQAIRGEKLDPIMMLGLNVRGEETCALLNKLHALLKVSRP